MPKIRLAAASLNQIPLDWEGNRLRIVAALDAAREAGAALLCLPELCISAYGCEDTFFAKGVQQTSLEVLLKLLPDTHGMVTTVGLPLVVDGVLYNASALIADGTLVGFAVKQYLAGDGIHYEPRWFHPWPQGKTSQVEIEGKSYPVGDLVFDCQGIKIGFEICRDAWVENRPGMQLAKRGIDILLNPSASHFAFGKQEIRRNFAKQAAREFHVAFVYCNLLGNESGRAIFDGGTLIAAGDRIVAEGPRLSFADSTMATADIDLETIREKRLEALCAAKPQAEVACEFQFPSAVDSIPATQMSPWDASPPPKEEEFARAVALGLHDYLRKSRSRGFVVSLSGGADSSAVATLVWLMVKLASNELGEAGFVERLEYLAEQSSEQSHLPVRGLLTCVYQATKNSGEVTRNAAESVAGALEAEFLHWSVDELVEGYTTTVSKAIGRELTWETDDVSLQNIQARARGPSVWLLANIRGALLLATSNRSEAAVGYATMDGDTCGGLSPIAGIDKAFLLDWLSWMETTGPQGVGPLPALAAVTKQAPTAELRPPSEGQTDEADLMPYAVLDAIERAAIRDRLMPLEVFKELQPELSEYSREQLGTWVERFFTLWCRNQWKRERYAPSFHLDDENLDPKTWCRFPILSSGFERELAELREYLAKMC
ncbi:NAD(+) synthase [Adhaeretor mobilis]|uniref:Glutamine-dependent NAD(+) synthetase n=1 Tax=Adhaeretor mobilis TaxID=1930276 RepID=A0A517MUM1_9BACT|nr:NAD(+) synthase [Adhaeretor mobilis]QDS98570.1 Glutamine-dependent NAD(+) synthetase [Adhaeretor mobilis]